LRDAGQILVVSCYELGRQPLAAAQAMAALEEAGFHPAALDVSVERLPDEALRQARLVAISAPMHTALQLGVLVAARARDVNPQARTAFFGLYAALNEEHLLQRHCDAVIAGEDARPLVELARAVEEGRAARPSAATPAKRELLKPSRGALPLLDRYAKLVYRGQERLVASVEASRGCKHLCKHCPIVPLYGGKFIAVPQEAVLADLDQQVLAGAAHVSFADADFLNGPTHALRIARELHARWPALTFDATIKIEHLLQLRALLPEFVACGLLFVVSAVESLNDEILRVLDKGHTAADVPLALQAVREAGAELRPTLLPYTPWTKLGDLAALFDFALEHDLVSAIDPVQYTLRLLLPPGSLLLEGAGPWLKPFDPQAFSYRWEHEDPRVDELWRVSSKAAGEGAGFDELRALALQAVGRPDKVSLQRRKKRREVPRLTEPWFC
jgi:radical SAM superfamily enzyme YgiQ (UPF0313 family)